MTGQQATIKKFEVETDGNQTTVTANGATVQIDAKGDVTAFTDEGIQVKTAAEDAASEGLTTDFNAISLKGTKIEFEADGSLVISAKGSVKLQPAAAANANALETIAKADDKATIKKFAVEVDGEQTTVTANGATVEFSDKGDVTTYTDEGIQVKPAAEDAASEGLTTDFGTISLKGSKVEFETDGTLVISAKGNVKLQPAAAAPGEEAAAAARAAMGPQAGDLQADGTVYVGALTDGTAVYAAAADTPICMTFNDAAKKAPEGFELPSEEAAHLLYENKNEGALAGTFKTDGGHDSFYWTSKSKNFDAATAHQFSMGGQHSHSKSNDASVRYVRYGK